MIVKAYITKDGKKGYFSNNGPRNEGDTEKETL